MRTQTINFKEFMNPHDSVLGFNLPDLEDLADQGFILFCSVGALAIVMAKLEQNFAKKGRHQEANWVSDVGFFLFPIVAIGAGIWYLFINNPIIRGWL